MLASRCSCDWSKEWAEEKEGFPWFLCCIAELSAVLLLNVWLYYLFKKRLVWMPLVFIITVILQGIHLLVLSITESPTLLRRRRQILITTLKLIPSIATLPSYDNQATSFSLLEEQDSVLYCFYLSHYLALVYETHKFLICHF